MLATSLSTRIAAFFLATLFVAIVNVLTVQALLRQLNGVAETVNVAGRLRMLSQQMAYLGTRALHEPAPAHRLALRRSIEDYDTALAALASGGSAFGYALRSPGTTMAAHLRALRQEWNATAALRQAMLSAPAGGDMAVFGARIAAAQSALLARAERLMLDLTEEARQAQREAMSRIYTLVAIDVLLLALAFARARRKLVAELERPFTILHQQVYVSASIGVCLYPRDGESEQTLLRNVDLAMYRTQREGRNTVRCFTEELKHHNRERQKMEAAMHHALETGGFELHYQPKVDYASGAVTGVEALVRWHHPDMGMIEPALFIPLAEETGLIERLGSWVLHTACVDNRAWQDAGGTPMVVAVNLSARQLSPDRLVRTVAQALAASGLAPRYLELELTETAIMHDAAGAIGILEEVKALGVRLSLDDFGTGYSSLDYLRRFPFDSIKIDRSFIAGIGAGIDTRAGDNDRAIVKTIIALASNLRMNVIAEGGERHEQAAFLLQHGCRDMQGCLFARAMPAAQLNALLAKGACPSAWGAGPTMPLKPEVSQA